MAGLALNPLVNKRRQPPPGSIMEMAPGSAAGSGGGLSVPRPGGLGFGGFAPPPGYGGQYGPQLPTNPTAAQSSIYGGGRQETDQMGRVITQTGTPGNSNVLHFNPATGMMEPMQSSGATTIEDPDALRRRRDLQDYDERLQMEHRYDKEPQQQVEETMDLRKLLDVLDDNNGGSMPRETPITAPGLVKGEPEADRRAAEAAEFGRAKDRVAKIGRGAIKSMTESSAGQGREGIDARNVRDIIRAGQGDLASVATEQALASLSRRNAVADRNYAGDISQRGQDIGVSSTNLGAGVTQRGQDLDARRSLLSLIPGLVGNRRLVIR